MAEISHEDEQAGVGHLPSRHSMTTRSVGLDSGHVTSDFCDTEATNHQHASMRSPTLSSSMRSIPTLGT